MTFTTEAGKLFHFNPKTFLKQMGPDCLIQITVNATRSFTEKSPRDVVYIGQDLFDNYYVVLDYDNKKIGLAGYTTDVVIPNP